MADGEAERQADSAQVGGHVSRQQANGGEVPLENRKADKNSQFHNAASWCVALKILNVC
jgi:hypothetical protein